MRHETAPQYNYHIVNNMYMYGSEALLSNCPGNTFYSNRATYRSSTILSKLLLQFPIAFLSADWFDF